MVLKCYERTNQKLGAGPLDDHGKASWEKIIWAEIWLMRMTQTYAELGKELSRERE